VQMSGPACTHAAQSSPLRRRPRRGEGGSPRGLHPASETHRKTACVPSGLRGDCIPTWR
jgi:hypothetical protein